MNILQVIPYFPPAWSYGGPVQLIYGISRELAKRGHGITVYTTDVLDATSRAATTQEMIDGIRVRRFRNLSNALAYRHKIFLSPGMVAVGRKELGRFDIIHMSEFRTFQNIMAHSYAKMSNIPYVMQMHGSLPSMMSKQGLKRLHDAVWGRTLLRDASRLIATTPTESEQFRGLGIEESRIVEIPVCIDIEQFQRLPARGMFREKYGITEKHIVLYLGRLHKIKGLDALVRASAGLMRQGMDVRLVIVGPDDGYLSPLQALIRELGVEEKVTVCGFTGGELKLAAYVDADVYVLPSLYESFSTTVLEAGACGTPVIVTDRCHIAPFVKDIFGLVVPHDAERLRDALRQLLTDEAKRTRFGAKGRELVRERYSWSSCAAQAEALYRDVLANRRR